MSGRLCLQQGDSPPPQSNHNTNNDVLVEFAAPTAQHSDGSERCNDDNEWDLLSDRLSRSSNHDSISKTNNNGNPITFGGTSVWVPSGTGSVRSINTGDFDNESSTHYSTSGGGILLPLASSSRRLQSGGSGGGGGSYGSQRTAGSHRMQRTHSNSTIDSNDVTGDTVLGPSGKGVLGVDYVEHVILPTDTLQGICIAYKISTTRLRQANHFSGHSLLLAPKKLVIPISKKALKSGFIRVQDTDAKEYKLYSFLAEFPKLAISEAKAYLELSDWDLKGAIKSAKEDIEWERDMEGTPDLTLKSGEIRFSATGGHLQARGAGLRSSQPQQLRSQPQHSTTQTQQQPPEAEAQTATSQFPPKQPSLSSGFGSRFSTVMGRSRMVSPIVSNDEDEDFDDDDDMIAATKNVTKERSDSSPHPQHRMSGTKAIVYSTIPAIATKSVQPKDLYEAAAQHDNYGVELQSVSPLASSSSAATRTTSPPPTTMTTTASNWFHFPGIAAATKSVQQPNFSAAAAAAVPQHDYNSRVEIPAVSALASSSSAVAPTGVTLTTTSATNWFQFLPIPESQNRNGD